MRVYDPDLREQAARIERAFPRWFVIWGTHSRQFWAFPCFRVPRGTIAHAARPDDLAGMMREIQHAAMSEAR
jgi:hypothetical protein